METTRETAVPALPTLDEGVYRLATDGRATGPLQSLVLDHLLFHDGPAYWADAAGHAETGSLARLAPSPRVLDRVRVARAFTAFQHYGLVDALAGAVGDDAGLVVLPALDAFYRGDDLARGEPARLLSGVADRLAALATDRDAPVLVTYGRDDALTRPVADVVDHELACERTRFGPRFVGDDFETLVYEDTRGVQTTLAFWERVLRARRDAAGTAGRAVAETVARTTAATGAATVGEPVDTATVGEPAASGGAVGERDPEVIARGAD